MPAAAKQKPPDRLDPAEMAAVERKPMLEPGRPYLFVMSYGWALVGFFVDRPEPLVLRVAHANHFHAAGKDYGRLAQEGAGPECEWRYEGTCLLLLPQVHHVDEYQGAVPRSRVRAD